MGVDSAFKKPANAEPQEAKDNKAKMLQAILMTTFSSSLFVGQGGRAKEYKESL
jgi:hypothetical protein